jgi:hypothetical protein
MARVIDIMNPQVELVIDEDNGKLKQAFLYVSGKNKCATGKCSEYELEFSSSAKITYPKPINGNELKIWYELQNKITQYNNERANNKRTTNSENNWCTFVYGFRKKNSCTVDIRFYDKTIICIEDKEILGLPKC